MAKISAISQPLPAHIQSPGLRKLIPILPASSVPEVGAEPACWPHPNVGAGDSSRPALGFGVGLDQSSRPKTGVEPPTPYAGFGPSNLNVRTEGRSPTPSREARSKGPSMHLNSSFRVAEHYTFKHFTIGIGTETQFRDGCRTCVASPTATFFQADAKMHSQITERDWRFL